MGLDEVRGKERNADYYFENFLRYYRNKDFKKSSEYLWKVINNLTYCIGSLENKKFENHTKIIDFLGELVNRGEITKEHVSAVQAIYTNAMRNVLDEAIFEIYRERVEQTIRILKNILKDKLISGASE